MIDVAALLVAVALAFAGLAVVLVITARRADRERDADRVHVGRHRRDLDALARIHERRQP